MASITTQVFSFVPMIRSRLILYLQHSSVHLRMIEASHFFHAVVNSHTSWQETDKCLLKALRVLRVVDIFSPFVPVVSCSTIMQFFCASFPTNIWTVTCLIDGSTYQLICLRIKQVKDKAYQQIVWFTAQWVNEDHNEWTRGKDLSMGNTHCLKWPGCSLCEIYLGYIWLWNCRCNTMRHGLSISREMHHPY